MGREGTAGHRGGGVKEQKGLLKSGLECLADWACLRRIITLSLVVRLTDPRGIMHRVAVPMFPRISIAA